MSPFLFLFPCAERPARGAGTSGTKGRKGVSMGAGFEESIILKIVNRIVEAVAVVAFAWFLVYCFGSEVRCTGQSMQPVIEDGDGLLVDRAGFKLAGPSRYDIAVFRSSVTGNVNIKRIIGLPGETVLISGGTVYINGAALDVPDSLTFSDISLAGLAETPVELSENEYFVLGDNRDASEDSRFESVGNVKASDLEGKAWFRISPFERMGTVR